MAWDDNLSCGHYGGVTGLQHVCVCARSIRHDGPHGCVCGHTWTKIIWSHRVHAE